MTEKPDPVKVIKSLLAMKINGRHQFDVVCEAAELIHRQTEKIKRQAKQLTEMQVGASKKTP